MNLIDFLIELGLRVEDSPARIHIVGPDIIPLESIGRVMSLVRNVPVYVDAPEEKDSLLCGRQL